MSSVTDIYSICPKCGNSFDPYSKHGAKKFCSRKCANSKTRSQEVKDKIRSTLKGRPSPKKGIKIGPKKEKIAKQCPICHNYFYTTRITCSRECFKIRATQNALKQEKHGGGHKGRYKGFLCDSTYELAFVVWHLDHNIPISRCHNVYDYIYEGKLCKYKPDFVVDNVEIEIKGFMSQRAQAKCDQNPHIFVVDKTSIQGFINYVKVTYNIKDLRDLYESKIHQKECIYCQKTYTAGYKNQKYCSHNCSIEHRIANNKLYEKKGKEEKNCIACEDPFAPRYNSQKYCCHKCSIDIRTMNK